MRLHRILGVPTIFVGLAVACLAINAVSADEGEASVDLDSDGELWSERHLRQVAHTLAVCSPLLEARTLLTALQPSPNAHLIDKVGSLAVDTRSWGRGMGWTDEVRTTHFDGLIELRLKGPLSTTLRVLPRFLRGLATLPTTILQSISASMKVPGLERRPARGSKVGGGKISKARMEKVQRMWSLIDEAEDRGCLEAIAMRAELRMVSPLSRF
jgi:hypothetical protein